MKCEDKNYSIHDIVLKRPASSFCHRWRDGTPIGSGKTGVLFYGGVSAEHLVINRSDLWHYGSDAPVPKISDSLSKMRKLSSSGNYRDAANIMYDALKENGYATELADMRVLGLVKLWFSCDGVYKKYRRVLHMDTAEAEVSYILGNCAYNRRYMMSRKRDIAAVLMTAECNFNFKLTAGFYDSFEGGREIETKNNDAAFAEYKNIKDCFVYSSKNQGKYFGIVCRAVSNGSVKTEDKGIIVDGADKTLLLVKSFSNESDRTAAELRTVNEILDCPESYEELFLENLPEYSNLYSSADISLYNGDAFQTNEALLEDARDNEISPQLAEKLWRFGRYLFISGAAPGALPFPLYGIWPCGYSREFTHHVANENVQSIYWHTDTGGLSELCLPLIDYYYSKTDSFRENAQNLFGCRGIFVGTYTTPINSKVAWYVPVILHFCGVAGWLSQHFYKYYLYSRDEKTLNEKIIPFMVATAEFYEDFHYLDENGKMVLYPAVSPENSPKEFYDKSLGHPMPVTKNPTIEFAILKELLLNLLQISKTHPELEEKAEIWQNMLNCIPEYMINEDGAIAEWMDPLVHDCYDHRHLSHLYPVFPGTEIEDSDDKSLLSAFEKAVSLREIGSYWGWSMPHMSAIYSRLRKTDEAFDCINALTKVCLLENFFTLGYDFRDMGITGYVCGNEKRACVQLDALMSFVNALQEMLVFSSQKILRLLPACPPKFSKGSANFRFITGKVNMSWDLEQKKCSGSITALRETDILLELPFGKEPINLNLKSGEVFTF